MKTIQKILALASFIFLAGTPVQAQQDVILVLDDGDCSIPITASSQVQIQAGGDVRIDVDDGNLPTCFGSVAALDVILTVVDPLGSSPIDIANGGTVNVTWTVVGFDAVTTSCTATGPSAFVTAFNASKAQNPQSPGSESYTLTSGTTFSISCSNSGDSEQTVVLVDNGGNLGPDGFPPAPEDCTPPVANRQNSFSFKRGGVNSTGVNYEDVWGLFPGGGEATLTIPRGEFLSLPFYAAFGGVQQGSTIGWVDGTSAARGHTVTISRCPGDFDMASLNPEFCAVSTPSTGGSLSAKVGVTPSVCDLVDGQIYYLNIDLANYDIFGTRTERCLTSSCSFLTDVGLF